MTPRPTGRAPKPQAQAQAQMPICVMDPQQSHMPIRATS